MAVKVVRFTFCFHHVTCTSDAFFYPNCIFLLPLGMSENKLYANVLQYFVTALYQYSKEI